MRLFIAFFIVLSVTIALDPPTFIAQLMGISWGALAGAFLGPFIFGLYWRKTTKGAVWASFIVGIGITVANMLFGFTSPITAGALAMLSSLVIVPIFSLVTPKLTDESINAIFDCYTETVIVSKKKSLEP